MSSPERHTPRPSGSRTRREEHPLLQGLGLGLAALMALPLLYLVVQAVLLAGSPHAAVLWQVETLWTTLRSLALAAAVATLCVGLCVPLAWLTHATDLPGRRAFRMLLILPLAVPSYVSGFVVVVVLGPTGWLQQALAPFGVQRLPDIDGALGATLALLYTFPYALLPMQAGLGRLDPRQWEAARTLGASPWRSFRRVVLPELRPAMAGGGLLIGLYVLSDFGAVSLLRFHSLSYVIYLRYRSLFDRGEAVYLGLLLAALAVAALGLSRRLQGSRRPAMGGGGSGRRWPVIQLGRWRWPALIYCSAVVAAGVGLPVFVVGTWLARRWQETAVMGALAEETLSTVLAGTGAAVLVMACALVPALLLRHGAPRVARWVYAASHVGYALPGIVVALSLVFLATRAIPAIYQTEFLLVFGYTVLFLPLALGALSEGFERQDPRLYEAARTLGSTRYGAWRRVVIPLARPALWAGLLAVFMSVIKELPATLLLSPIGFRALSTRIWSLTEDGFFAEAAPPIGMLLLLAGLSLVLRPDIRIKPPHSGEGT